VVRILPTVKKEPILTDEFSFLLAEKEGFEEDRVCFLEFFSYKYVMFYSEIIKFCTSQSSCFIRNHPIKGQNKGQNDDPGMKLNVQVKEFYGTIY